MIDAPEHDRYAPTPDVRLLLLCALLAVPGCGSPTDAGDDPPDDGSPFNDRIEHANGIYFPESCAPSRSSLALLGHLELPEPLLDVWGYYDAASDREYALAGFQPGETSDGGLYVIDVTDPSNPTLTATVEEAKAHDVVVWRNYAYTVTGHFGEEQLGVVYDLTDPADPVPVGTFPSGHNLFVSDRGYMYKALPGVVAYDLEFDPTAPRPIWRDGSTGGHDVTVIDDVLLDFHDFDGTRLYDVSDPFSPLSEQVLESDSVRFHHSGWMSDDGRYLYINDELPSNLNQNPDITVWDVAAEEIVATFRDTSSTVHNSYVVCDRLVVAYYAKGLVLLDVSDPTDPTLLDAYDTDPDAEEPGLFLGAWGAFPYTRSGNVLVSDVDKGLYVFGLE